MAMVWSNEITFKFIDLYHSEPAIWNPRNSLHKDKTVVNEAWERISEEMSIPISELKKKKETLMAAFRLNHKKKLTSTRSGDPGDNFTPIWTFYEPLAAFLADVYDYKPSNNLLVNNTDEGSSSFSNFQEKWNPVIEIGVEELSNGETSSPPNPKRKRRHSETKSESDYLPHICDTFISSALSAVANVINQNKTEEDDCDLFGKLLAIKLRKLSELERWETMYEIDGLFIQKQIKTEPRHLDGSDYNEQ